jgi:hypothetical protein
MRALPGSFDCALRAPLGITDFWWFDLTHAMRLELDRLAVGPENAAIARCLGEEDQMVVLVGLKGCGEGH